MMADEDSAEVLLNGSTGAGSCCRSDSVCANTHADSRAIQCRRQLHSRQRGSVSSKGRRQRVASEKPR